MNKEEVKEALYQILIKELGFFQNEIKETNTPEDMGMDSLDILELVNEAEKSFHLTDLEQYILTTTPLDQIIDSIHQLKN